MDITLFNNSKSWLNSGSELFMLNLPPSAFLGTTLEFVRMLGLTGFLFSSLAGCHRLPPNITTLFQSNPVETALIRAGQENKRILIDFYADWCSPCKQLETLLRSPEIRAEMDKNYILVRVNADTIIGKLLVDQYQVHGFPVILILREDGSEQRRLEGGFDKNGFLLAALQEAVDEVDKLSVLLERWNNLPEIQRTSNAAIEIGKLYIERANAPEAIRWMKLATSLDKDPKRERSAAATYVLGYDLYMRRLDAPEKAFPYFRQVVDKYPHTQMAAYAAEDLANHAMVTNPSGNPLQVFMDLMSQAPDNLFVRHRMARFCLKNKIYLNEAMEAVQDGVQKTPKGNDFGFLEDLADLSLATHQCDKARQFAKQALQQSPHHPYTQQLARDVALCKTDSTID